MEISSSPCSSAKSSSSGRPRHVVLLLVDDLAQHSRRVQAGQRARSTAASVWPARLSTPPWRASSGKMWPGRSRSVGRVVGIAQRLDRRGAVVRRDARRRAVPEVHAHRERGALALGVVRLHLAEVELAGALGGDRRADQARGVVEEERDLVGRRRLGRHDQVALVLAVLVVDDDDDLATTDRLDRVLDPWRAASVVRLRVRPRP